MNKKNHNIINSIALILILTLFLAINVTALGIAPSTKIIEYNTEENIVTSRVINNNAQNLVVTITASGDLAQYITINNPTLYISSNEYEKEFTYTIILPENVGPGIHNNQIIITETAGASSDNSVGGRIALTQQLIINAKYVGLHAEGDVTITTTPENDPIISTLNIDNKGTEVITSLTGTITIKDSNNKSITTKKIAEKNNILPKENIVIDNIITIDKPGKYTAKYEVDYDNKKLIIEKEFITGKPEIEIVNTQVNNFRLGTTAKFDINVLNNWNIPISDVYGEIIISDTNNTIIGKTTISRTQINPKTDTIIAYWDTANIKAGEYLIKINIQTTEKTLTQEYKATIEENMITIIDTTTSETKKQYYIITIITVMLWIVILVLLIKKNTKKQKPYK